MKSVHVHYFGLLGERRGLAEEAISTNATTAGDLYAEISSLHPLGVDPQHLRVAVNDRFVDWSQTLNDRDRVAFLPPMSGG